jgi:hypothetical protein
MLIIFLSFLVSQKIVSFADNESRFQEKPTLPVPREELADWSIPQGFILRAE